MQKRNVKRAGRVAACAVSAAIMFSSMHLELIAKEANGLPSAGIDYFLSANATSVKSLKEEEPERTSSEENIDEDAEEMAFPTATATATAAPTATATPMKEDEEKEEKVIEETMMASTTKTVNQKERELEAKREEEGFKSLVIARVNDYVNVRSIPSEEGEILGKLYDKSVGEFISEENGWYKITSGSVTGYVKAEYCVTGDDAVALAKAVGTRIATVTTTTLKVREDPGLDTTVLGLVPIEDQLLVT
ncbi:MAG: SH3 domain-containing protein [Lachnospiraceae bacterium]|nr:SH3 domain-containing protein [Lachnospiraceae bacterium]